MIGKEIIIYSLKNLWSKKSRSLLTILSILIGIATIFIFISFGWGLYDYTNSFATTSTADKIIIQAKGSGAPGLDTTFKLTEDDLKAVEKSAGVYEATGAYLKVAEITQNSEKKYIFITTIDPKSNLMTEMFNIDIDKGRELRSGDEAKALLGYNYQVADKIFSKPYDINDNIEVQGQKLKIIGFYESIGNPQDDSNIYITNNFYDGLFPGENKSFGMIVARADINNLDWVIENVEKSLRKSKSLEEGKEDFFVQSFDDLLGAYSDVLNIIIGFIILIALISVLVSAINTANTMVTSVIERIREIGVMKSIGARNSEIFKIFLFESSFLGFVAGIVGVSFGWVVTSTLESFLKVLGWGFLTPHYSWHLFTGCILFATITGAISGAFPALQASKTNVVDALRYE